MNVLMIRPDAVLVETDEVPIQKMFESLGIKCIKVFTFSKISQASLHFRPQFALLTLSEVVSTAGQLMFVERVNSRVTLTPSTIIQKTFSSIKNEFLKNLVNRAASRLQINYLYTVS